jgi:hypothetical protein
MRPNNVSCPDCDHTPNGLDRRDFLRTVGITAATVAGGVTLFAEPKAHAAPTAKSAAETAVKGLYDSLTEEQRKAVCFEWNHQHPKWGLLRTHISNNWQITPQTIRSGFYTAKQQDIIHDIFQGLTNPEWYGKFLKQLRDDTGGKLWGTSQSIAIFGKPGTDQFEFVMTGRHMTIRADGNTEAHVAFGGPIFYGHQASQVTGLREKDGHPGNVFWHQALLANGVYKMLDDKQQKKALVEISPKEEDVSFQGEKGKFPGIPIKELSDDQKKAIQKVLASLLEPYRTDDQDEVMACLKKQGGLDACNLAFYQDLDLGNDKVWDNWRVEGPSFVWYYRGFPHVHVWVHVADDSSVKLNS